MEIRKSPVIVMRAKTHNAYQNFNYL